MAENERVRHTAEQKALFRRVIARLYCEKKGPQLKELLGLVNAELDTDLHYMTFVRLTNEAIQQRLIDFVYRATPLEDLQERLITKFQSLREAIVITTAADTISHLQTLGKEAAEYFDKLLSAEQYLRNVPRIAVSGGRTIFAMMDALPERKRRVECYPTALLPCGPYISEVDPFVSLWMLWSKSFRHPQMINYQSVPLYPSPDLANLQRKYERLKLQMPFQGLWKRMQEVDIVFAGVGQIEIDDDWRKAGREFLPLLGGRKIGEKKISISCLRQHGVVGDMSYCFFDATGTTRKREWNPFCALGTDWFRAMAAQYPHKRVVFVGGLGKEKALRAALAGQLCNVLITDETAARRLLESEGF